MKYIMSFRINSAQQDYNVFKINSVQQDFGMTSFVSDTEASSETEGATAASSKGEAPPLNVALPTHKMQTISRCLADNLRQLLVSVVTKAADDVFIPFCVNIWCSRCFTP